MRSMLFTSLILASFAACHDHDHEGFDTFQACFDDHHGSEGLGIQESIVVCCLDHPIHGMPGVCGATAADCVTYLTTNLSATSATQAELQGACDEYIAQKGM
jgi:hypothetical protein